MKKAISLLLALVMCLSLCACGGNNKELEKYKKYETLINYLEAEDYENAYYEFLKISMGGGAADTTPNAGDKETTTIEISLDNWQEYFEIREEVAVSYNGFGEVEQSNFVYYFCLKDAYADRMVAANIAIEYSATGKEARWFSHNNDTKEVVMGDLCTEQEMKDRNFGMPDASEDHTDTKTVTERQFPCWLVGFGTWPGFETSGNVTKWVGAHYQQFDILRIQGTLTLTAE